MLKIFLFLFLCAITTVLGFQECESVNSTLESNEKGMMIIQLPFESTFTLKPYFKEILDTVPEQFRQQTLEILEESDLDLIDDCYTLIDQYKDRVKRNSKIFRKVGKAVFRGGAVGVQAGKKLAKPIAEGVKNAVKTGGKALKPNSKVVKFLGKTAIETVIVTAAVYGVDKIVGKDAELELIKNATEWTTIKTSVDGVIIPMKVHLFDDLQNLVVYHKFEQMLPVIDELERHKVGFAAISSLAVSREGINMTLSVEYYDSVGPLCFKIDPGYVNESLYSFNETTMSIHSSPVSHCQKNFMKVKFCKLESKGHTKIHVEELDGCFHRTSATRTIVATKITAFKLNGTLYRTPDNGVINCDKDDFLEVAGCLIPQHIPPVVEEISKKDHITHHQLDSMHRRLYELEKQSNLSIFDKLREAFEKWEIKILLGTVSAFVLVGFTVSVVYRCCF